MWKNYFVVAWRNLLKQKWYTLLNISGLALGMGVTILILLFVQYELNYDKDFADSGSIYRLQRNYLNSDGSVRQGFASLAPSFSLLFEDNIPEFENIARMYRGSDFTLERDRSHFVEENVYLVDPDFFDILDFEFIKGNPSTALLEPASIVLCEEKARKYFGDEEAIGQELLFDNLHPLIVTGIIKNPPQNNHISPEVLISYNVFKLYGDDAVSYWMGDDNYSNNVTYLYAKVKNGVTPEQLQARIKEVLNTRFDTIEKDDGSVLKPEDYLQIGLMPIEDIHIYSQNPNEFKPGTDLKTIYLFTSIALLILIIACINFVNLATARAASRSREVGMRKVIGATRRILITQFFSESIIISLLALVLAVTGIILVLPWFNSFSNTNISFLNNLQAVTITVGIFIFTGLISGIYPAFYLSAFKPSTILRGELTRGKKGNFSRKILVVFQFVITVTLIICVSIITRQMNYMQKAKLGFDRENILLFPTDQLMRDNWASAKQKLLSNPGVLSVTASKRIPSGRLLDDPGFKMEVYGELKNGGMSLPNQRVDFGFLKTYGIDLVAGRDFDPAISTDSSYAFILNETAVKRLGWKSNEDVLGIQMSTGGREGTVIGVIKDFHFESMHFKISPMVLHITENTREAAVRISPVDVEKTIAHIKNVWDEVHPSYPFEYHFLDQNYENLYKNEQKSLEMFTLFSLLAIAIACLGLIGLASFTAERRTREIGIRKTLGASETSIIKLITGDFVKLVGIGFALAIPVGWYFMQNWLENFSYRIEMTIFDFIFAGTLAMVIAMLSVIYQAVRASFTNPIKALKTE